MPIATNSQRRDTRCRRRDAGGFTLTELMIILVILGLLITLAVPAYTGYVERSQVQKAIADIGAIAMRIERFRLHNNDQLPNALSDLGPDIPLDPWGQQYRYLNIWNETGKGKVRKDGALNPINANFDLYSIGRDGESKLPLPPPQSHDDIIWANDGTYVGLAKDY